MSNKTMKIRLIIILIQALYFSLDGCSIVGYIGNVLCKLFIEQGLSRLEYRGYDSAGFACLSPFDNKLIIIKAEGKLEKLKEKLKQDMSDGYIGIGHTRWATHGAITQNNAHPHIDCQSKIAIVHNGIIENFFELKQKLIEQGHSFQSQTDSEVIAHTLEHCLKDSISLEQAIAQTVTLLKGTYAFIALISDQPDKIVAVRKSSPLCIGIGTNETFIASDFLAFTGKTNKVVFMPDESFAIVTKNSIDLLKFDNTILKPEIKLLNVTPEAYEKLGHEYFMLKEIYEQRKVIKSALQYYRSLGHNLWKHIGIDQNYAHDLKSIQLFGCGTSWHAARIAQFFFETICGIPTSVHLASEFRYMPFFKKDNTLYIAISQSGETADTLEALRLIKSYDLPVITLTNVPLSTMVRESLGYLPLKAGPEIAVASTKAFTTQVSALYWLAHRIALEKGRISIQQLGQAENNVLHAADILEEVIDKYSLLIANTYAKKYAQVKRFMYLGRHISYPFAMEGALKLKEISYIFAQGYPAGELKHGTIALIDSETPSLIFSHLDPTIYQKLLSNAQEVKARKGHIIAFAFEGQEELIKLADQAFIIPRVAPMLEPLAMAGLMQLFTYYVAKELGRDIDKPRNLAKAVTVE